MILQRVDGTRFSEVRPAWRGRTVVILGGGPSLSPAQFERVAAAWKRDDINCIAVNAAYLRAPWADLLHGADGHFWNGHALGAAYPSIGISTADALKRFFCFCGERSTVENSGGNVADDRVHMLRIREAKGLSTDPGVVHSGRNSLYQALNIAVLAGAARIILLGADGKPGADGRTHWHGGHQRATPAAFWPLVRQAFSSAENQLLELGVEVLNASPGTAIDSFPKADLEDLL